MVKWASRWVKGNNQTSKNGNIINNDDSEEDIKIRKNRIKQLQKTYSIPANILKKRR